MNFWKTMNLLNENFNYKIEISWVIYKWLKHQLLRKEFSTSFFLSFGEEY